VLKYLLVDPASAPCQVQPEGCEKEQNQRKTEGVRVELQQQATAVDRTRCLRVAAPRCGSFIIGIVLVQVLGFV
jgi:hypothetical protein